MTQAYKLIHIRNISHGARTFTSIAALFLCSCSQDIAFDPENPASGLSELIRPSDQVATLPLPGGDDTVPATRNATPPAVGEAPNCDNDCVTHCDEANLQNPINQGACLTSWGVGLSLRPVDGYEACRRVYMDTIGRFPTQNEVENTCIGQPWSRVVSDLIQTQEFTQLCRERWADTFRYNNVAVSVSRIYDLDAIVTRLCDGTLSYGAFVEVAATHPVVTRTKNTAADIAEYVFTTFLGRPPFLDERADFARLYALWQNDYYDNPALGMRLPDAWVAYRCLNDDEETTEATKGQCTSLLFGQQTVTLRPDLRATQEVRGVPMMWSGLMTAEEWKTVQAPGRTLAGLQLLWESAADRILQLYFGYDVSLHAPAVRTRLTDYFLQNGGSWQALHYAVLTSIPYLQSAYGTTSTDHRITFGPLKKTPGAPWIKSISDQVGVTLGSCDHRISLPQEFLNQRSPSAIALVRKSNWSMRNNNQIDGTFRDLARTLGDCQDNDPSGRFSIISVLTSGAQISFAADVCGPGEAGDMAASIGALIPDSMSSDTATNADIAESLLRYQSDKFFGRPPTADEVNDIRVAGEGCNCSVEEFARPLCYAMVSSAEMLFY